MDSFTELCESERKSLQSKTNKSASRAVNRMSLLLLLVLLFTVFFAAISSVVREFFSDAVMTLLVWFFSSFAGHSLVDANIAADKFLNSDLLSEIVVMLRYIICFFVPVYIAIRIEDKRIYDFVSVKGKLQKSFFAYTFLTVGLASIFSILSSLFFGDFSNGSEVPDLTEYSVPAIIVWFIATTVVPALIEEFIFRGYILNSLVPFGKGFAVCVSAVLFALMHSKDSVLFALCAGILFSYFTLETGNIKTSVLIHFINNALSCSLLICDQLAPDNLSNIISAAYPIIVYTLMTAGALILVYRFRNTERVSDAFDCVITAEIKSLITPIFLLVVFVFLLLN